MRNLLIAACAAGLTLSAGPVFAEPDSLVDRAEAAAAAAGSSARAKISTTQANATAAFLLGKRDKNWRIGSNLGLHVVDPVTGDEVYAKNADKPMLPASNMKIVTGVTALKVLGPDSRMTTDTIVPRRGAVILRGGGDTTLGVEELTALAKKTSAYVKANKLKAKKVRPPSYRPSTCTVNGKVRKSTNRRPCPLVTPRKKRPAMKVYVDDSLYSATKRGPGWTSSYQPYIVRPVRPLGRIGVYGWDSASEAGSVFASALRAAGLKSTYAGHENAGSDAQAAAAVQGDTVASQVRYMLQVSENNIAEMLFRQVAVERGRKGSWKGARLAARDTLRELGIKTKGLKLMDGSGVSRADRLTPRMLTDLLTVALDTETHPEFESFFDALPIGGRSGTLAARNGRYTTKPSACAAGKVWAKTGTLFDTIGLSGYTRGQDDEIKVFSALVNDRPQSVSPLTTRQAVDGLVATVQGCWGPTKKTGEPPVVFSEESRGGATVQSTPSNDVAGTVYGQ